MKGFYFFMTLLALGGTFLFGKLLDSRRMMIPEFTVPYFSGSALSHHQQGWIFNINEVDSLHALLSIPDPAQSLQKINAYKFEKKIISSHEYNINEPGYMYIISLARFVFPLSGDIGAVKYLQLLVHSLVSLCILFLLKRKRDQWLFMILYTLNPFIILYAVYPFYYFWTMLPSAILICILLYRKPIPVLIIACLSILFAALVFVRSTVLPVTLLSLVFALDGSTILKKFALWSLYLITLLLLHSDKIQKHPGHIMYTSLGAYPNSFVTDLSDTVSWNGYMSYKGEKYSYTSTPSMYDKEVFFGESAWCLREFKKIAKAEPLMIIRNATLNFFESYSLGYFRKSGTGTAVSFILGLFFFSLLLFRKKYKMLLIIAASFSMFFAFTAPLPVYLYGSYILLAYAFIEILPSKES